MALSPQLAPTDYATIESVADRDERERLYIENAIYRHALPQGTRYTKGTSRGAEKRSWQSLDAILRSDRNASAALPYKQLRRARIFTALTITSLIVAVAGAAASAREGLDFSEVNGTGAILLGGGLATAGFAISAGIFYGKSKKGYDRAVDIYNDSLGMRLGMYTPEGEYIPPRGAIIDKDGNILLEEPEAALGRDDDRPAEFGPAAPDVTPDEVAPEPAPAAERTEAEDEGDTEAAHESEDTPAEVPPVQRPRSEAAPSNEIPAPKPEDGLASRRVGVSLSPRAVAP